MGDWMEVDLENEEKYGHESDVTRQSCGCLQCDLGLPVLQDSRGPYHETYQHPGVYRVPCTKPLT